jgi:hypothetical protein
MGNYCFSQGQEQIRDKSTGSTKMKTNNKNVLEDLKSMFEKNDASKVFDADEFNKESLLNVYVDNSLSNKIRHLYHQNSFEDRT